MDWLTAPWQNLFLVAVSVVGIYIALIILTRLVGVRSFSKLSAFDFAITVAIGSVIAGTVIAADPPLLQGMTALAMLFGVQLAVAIARKRSAGIEGLVNNPPRLVMVRERILHDQLRRAQITESDLRSKLREANILRYEQIEAVIAESTGDVSVLHHDGDGPALDPALLEGVVGADRYRDLVGESPAPKDAGA